MALTAVYNTFCGEYIDERATTPSYDLPSTFPCPRLRLAAEGPSTFCYPSDFSLAICTLEGRLEELVLGDDVHMLTSYVVGARMRCVREDPIVMI